MSCRQVDGAQVVVRSAVGEMAAVHEHPTPDLVDDHAVVGLGKHGPRERDCRPAVGIQIVCPHVAQRDEAEAVPGEAHAAVD
eukprot:CAMPEP_0168368848 /NCGR_PEP_ID=MMETSP0228-20121227/6458_1 /TAXON_ID=133427 /ORGANISM="Protoceratium reticulatum, Strain CCCM 535 (=CCMP 1889)" /LENGTH=81 /DNA_ID=CAMNT_0008381699 /DNA_START=558 /DNA_END=800 /DNA_ORIENTATION=+